MYRHLIRPLLFRLSPEKAHHLSFWWLRWLHRWPHFHRWARRQFSPRQPKPVELWGLHFPHPVGLAAGFDKDGRLIKPLSAYSFSFIEVGTVTPRPQPGNPRPRLFRLPADQGLINRMGFNNLGADALAQRLTQRPGDVIVGGNIGKNKDTPNERAAEDYLYCFRQLHAVVDYFVVNVSSPNTPNLRALQDKEPLTALLQELQEENQKLDKPRPLLLKIAPDLSEAQLDDILEIAHTTRLDGLIATNTTIVREGLRTPASRLEAIGAGGLSGAPLRQRSTEVIRYLRQNARKPLPIIAVGGIFSPADVEEKLAAGASLVQVYTGFIYRGPGLVRRLVDGLSKQKKSSGT